ncbi:MAG: GIY-YIG nuclease family protein [Phycisphaerales bacterium]
MNTMRSRVADTKFPYTPGVYLVYESSAASRPLYIGKAGNQGICSRWLKQHLKDRSGGSALRRSIGIHLNLVGQKLRRPDRQYPPSVEMEITRFLNSCYVEIVSRRDADQAETLEKKLILEQNPILNIQGRKTVL